MSEINRQEIPTQHSAEDVWEAINTPITGELGRLVNPFVAIEYEDLSDGGMIQQGTLIVYRPVIAQLEPKLGLMTSALPKDITMRVKEHNSHERCRVDELESDKHSGFISHNARKGVLVLRGEMRLGGSKKMFESTIASYAEKGLLEHNQRLLHHASLIGYGQNIQEI